MKQYIFLMLGYYNRVSIDLINRGTSGPGNGLNLEVKW
jgi:hypothetical protein